jgi:hypothetical protein
MENHQNVTKQQELGVSVFGSFPMNHVSQRKFALLFGTFLLYRFKSMAKKEKNPDLAIIIIKVVKRQVTIPFYFFAPTELACFSILDMFQAQKQKLVKT